MAKKHFYTLFLALLTLSCAPPPDAKPPIKVGSLMPYTNAPEWSKKYDEGMLLAVNEINAKGGVLGRPLAFLRRDSKFDISETTKILEEWHLKENVNLYTGTLAGHIASTVSQYAQKKQKLFLATTICHDALTWEEGNQMTFKLHPPCSSLGRMLAQEAAKLPAQRWAFIGFHSAYNNQVRQGFTDHFAKVGRKIEWVEEQWTPLFKLNAGAAINAIRKSKPDAILNLLVAQDQQKFIRYGHTVGLFDEIKTILSPNFGLPEEYKTIPKQELPENWISGVYPWKEIPLPEHKAFIKSFAQAYQSEPYYTSLLAYMNVYALAAAVEKAGTDAPKKVAKAMRGLTFKTPLGEIQFRKLDQQATLGFWVGTLGKNHEGLHVKTWAYKNLQGYLPPDEWIQAQRQKSR